MNNDYVTFSQLPFSKALYWRHFVMIVWPIILKIRMKIKSWKSRCCQSWFLLRVVRKSLFHAFLLASGSFRHSVTCRFHTPVSSMTFPLCMLVLVSKFPPCISASVIGVDRAHPNDLIWLALVKILSPNKITFWGNRELVL